MCPEVEKGHTEASWSTGSQRKLDVLATIRASKGAGHHNLGDNFCQIQSPEATFTLFAKYSKVFIKCSRTAYPFFFKAIDTETEIL